MEPSSAPWRVIDDAQPVPASPSSAGLPRAPSRRWLALGTAVVAVVVAVGAVVGAARPDALVAAPGAQDPVAEMSTGGVGGSPSAVGGFQLVIEVGGAVRHPGLYRLAPGSRVGDAIEAAGGYGPRVDAAAADRALNLARRLEDGDEVHVPSRDETALTATTAPAAPGGGTTGGPVNLNIATAEALDALPGVGPATAAKIIAARAEQPFRTLDELVSRKVLSQTVLARIRDRVTVSG